MLQSGELHAGRHVWKESQEKMEGSRCTYNRAGRDGGTASIRGCFVVSLVSEPCAFCIASFPPRRRPLPTPPLLHFDAFSTVEFTFSIIIISVDNQIRSPAPLIKSGGSDECGAQAYDAGCR